LIVIRAHIKEGDVNDYVDRTILAVRDAGWIQPDELKWYKVSGPALGSRKRPRRAHEHILWFSKTTDPYADFTAHPSDVFVAYLGSMDRRIMHPAMFPPTLVRQLMSVFAKPGTICLDPFAGSGTTCLVAQSLGYDFIGFDSKEEYVDLANDRLKNEAKYLREAGILKYELEQVFNRSAFIEEQRRGIAQLEQTSTLLPQAEAVLGIMMEKRQLLYEKVKDALGATRLEKELLRMAVEEERRERRRNTKLLR
jgi:hypothetical protein